MKQSAMPPQDEEPLNTAIGRVEEVLQRELSSTTQVHSKSLIASYKQTLCNTILKFVHSILWLE